MKSEICYGVIPLKNPKAWEVLLVLSEHGFWGFPKGHPEQQEIPLQTAERELYEETKLSIKNLLYPEPVIENYHLPQGIPKTVYYYLAEVEGTVSLQSDEIKNFQWLPLQQALTTLTYPSTQKTLQSAIGELNRFSK